MKFQKGLLDDIKRPSPPIDKKGQDRGDDRQSTPPPLTEDRLFQTHQRTSTSWLQYMKMLGVVSIFVLIGGAAAFYLTLPGKGDRVRPPRGLEDAVRAHLLDVEKRNATDILVYYCESYYWARVEVERRPDIKTNPIYRIGSYAARATSIDDKWKIDATPITAPEIDQPCSQ